MRYYIDKNQISRLASNVDTYHKGYAYWLNGHVRSMDLAEKDGAIEAQVLVSGTGLSRENRVTITFDKNGMLQKYRCMCSGAGIWQGACKHVVAALLRLFEANRENVKLSRSARVSGELLKHFEALVYDEVAAATADASAPLAQAVLAPRFVVESNGAALSFAIGQGKMYIVKNMREFIQRMREGAAFAYGKAFSLAHKPSAFAPESRAMLDFVLREYALLDALGTDASPHGMGTHAASGSGRTLRDAVALATNARNMPLTTRGLDTFFDLCAGQTVDAAVYGTVLDEVHLTDAPPDVRFVMEEADGGLSLSLDAALRLFEGEAYHYVLHEDCLHRVSKAWGRAVAPLLQAFGQLGGQKLTFTRRETPHVRTFLAARLRTLGLLQTTDTTVLEDAPPLVAKAYFDTDSRAVTAELAFCYGEETFAPQQDYLDSAAAPNQPQVLRDVMAELHIKAMLAQMGFVPDAASGAYKLTGNDQIFRFYHEPSGVEALRAAAEVYVTDAVRNIADKPRVSAAVGLRITGDLLEVKVNPEGFPMLELMDILDSFRTKKKYHRLRDGSFIRFTNEDENAAISAVDELVQSLGAGKKELGTEGLLVPRFRAPAAGEVLARRADLRAEQDASFRNLLDDMAGRGAASADCPVPPPLADVLRGYQAEGFRWLKALDRAGFGGILADDMGLGKTVQIIAVLLAEKLGEQPSTQSPHRPSLVITPTSLVYNWEKEIARFAPSLDVCMVCGTPQQRQNLLQTEAMRADVLITTYDMLKRDIALYQALDVPFRFIVADEAQNIKNPATQNAKAIRLLNGTTRYALTGTPVENALVELWSIFEFVMPGYLHSRTKFAKLYEEPILREDDKNTAARLRQQIAPFILRRLKADVLTELPEKIETTLYAEMTTEQQKVYTAYLMQAKGELSDSLEGQGTAFAESRIEILSKLTRLRQLCCHPATFMENYKGGSGKLDVTIETVKDSVAAGHRLLIFSQFTKMLSILAAMLDEAGIAYFYLDGATPARERLDMAERFNNGEREVFLISLKAGGTGLNLIGADVVIHYDPWWNPAVMEQAADRAHRFGQSKTVQVINIVAKDSVEEKIMTLQAKKKDLIDAVIAEGAQFLSRMTREEIRALFG